ncbi:MAG: hypothetical protein J2P23_12180 [Microlunatus sp.]|nr:hypothetical protein [Microlunatus sp.]
MSRKTRKGRRAIAAAQDNLPVGPFVHQAADRVGPLAHDAVDRIGPLAHQAADRIGPLAQDAADRIAPLAQAAADRIQPYAKQAADKVRPYAEQAADRVGPYVHQAADWLDPYAETARKKGAMAAAQAVEVLGPKLDDAAGKIGPAVDDARERLQSDLLPKLSEKLTEMADSEAVTKAAKKGKELLPSSAKKKRRWPKALAIVAGVLTVGGAAYYAAKKFLGSNEEPDWQTTRPSTPYASTTVTEPQPEAATAETGTDSDAASALTAPEPDEGVPTDDEASGTTGINGTSEADVPAEEPQSKYGEGSYVGTEPPEGFTIKGNERSKKFHISGSDSYDRTSADVWFNSESAAETAGFSKAKR